MPTELVGLPGSAPEAGNGRPMPETSFKRVDARGGLSGIAADKTVKIRLSASAASAASAPALPVVGGDGNHTPPYCRLDQLPAELMQEIFCRLHVTESRTFALVSRKLQASSQPWRDALYLLGKMAIDGDRSEPRWADILPWALEAYRNLPTLYAKKICASFSRRFCLLLITQDPFAGDQG
ncbi:MAG: F-box protein, partial [Janthinobacterium lividum]